MPYCGGATLHGHPLFHFFDKARRADIPGRVVRMVRDSVTEGFRSRVVLKLTRGQLCLRAAQNTFSMPIIFICRDPRAIVASMRTASWSRKWERQIDRLFLQEQLLQPLDGRADFFSTWRDEILEFDKRDSTVRLTAYWAFTEKFVQHCYADQQERIVFISYEELCRRKAALLSETLERLGVNHGLAENFRGMDVDTFVTTEHRRGITADERIAGWKKVLSRSEIALVESIVHRFGLEETLV